MEWLFAVTAAASALSAVLAWVAKIRWSQEFASAKNEIIKSKDSQITLLEREIIGLKEMTPMKIREYFISVRCQLEEFNENLKNQLEDAKEAIARRDSQIDKLIKQDNNNQEIIKSLKKEIHNLEKIVKSTKSNEFVIENDKNEIWQNWVNLKNNISNFETNRQKTKLIIDNMVEVSNKEKFQINKILESLKIKGFIDLKEMEKFDIKIR